MATLAVIRMPNLRVHMFVSIFYGVRALHLVTLSSVSKFKNCPSRQE